MDCEDGYSLSTDTPDTLLCDEEGGWLPPVTCDGKNMPISHCCDS